MTNPSTPAFNAAVLTGDIVSSSRLAPEARRKLPRVLGTATDRLRAEYGKAVPFGVDIFRGDSWQLIIVPPQLGLRAALFLRAALRENETMRLDSRIAMGIGPVDFVPPESVSSGDGEAFRLSGMALETMPRSRRLKVALPEGPGWPLQSALPVVVALVDELVKRWTVRQARAALGAMRGLTQEMIGREWAPAPISQQAIAQHLDGAGWNAIEEALSHFELIVPELVSRAAEP